MVKLSDKRGKSQWLDICYIFKNLTHLIMKKALLFTLSLLIVSMFAFAQDSTKKTIKTKTHHASKKYKAKPKTVGQKIDTGAKKVGNFTANKAVGLASDITTSRDKSMHGPNDEKVFNGKRGGKYYINKKGKKIYLKKDKAL